MLFFFIVYYTMVYISSMQNFKPHFFIYFKMVITQSVFICNGKCLMVHVTCLLSASWHSNQLCVFISYHFGRFRLQLDCIMGKNVFYKHQGPGFFFLPSLLPYYCVKNNKNVKLLLSFFRCVLKFLIVSI